MFDSLKFIIHIFFAARRNTHNVVEDGAKVARIKEIV